MSVREYIGARYVPVFASPIEWNSANTYEPLTIVLHQGNSFTSRQAVPTGIDIANTAYWVQTGNYNAQIEQCRQDIVAVNNRFPVSIADGGTGATGAAGARTNLDAAQADGASNTLYAIEQMVANNSASISAIDTFTSRGCGEATGDYDDYISMGVWAVDGRMTARKPSPDHALSGVLIIFSGFNSGRTTSLYTAQLYLASNGQAFFRIYLDTTNTWNPWRELKTS